jgi:hypothetical protein
MESKYVNLAEKVFCIEVLERIARIQTFLRLEPDSTYHESRELINIFKAALKKIYSNLELTLNRLSENVELEPNERLVITRRLTDTFDSITKLHESLQIIYGAWVRPEAHVFVKNVLEIIPEDRRPERISITLSNKYSFSGGDLSSYFEDNLQEPNIEIAFNRETPIVFLPKIERDNPLNWAILAHECGHIDHKGFEKLLKNNDIIPDQVDEYTQSTIYNWTREIYSDIFATRILGPAYLASFATFSFMSGQTECATKRHPADIVRINVVRQVLEKNNLKVELNESWLDCNEIGSFYYRILEELAKIVRIGTSSLNTVPVVPIVFQDFIDASCEHIEELISLNQQITLTDLSRIGDLARLRLIKGIPIASYPDPKLREAAIKLSRNKSNSERKFNKLTNAIQEHRTLIWEIVNSGWLHKLEYIYPTAFDLFFKPNKLTLENKVTNLEEELSLCDRILLKSIESSEVQRLMSED